MFNFGPSTFLLRTVNRDFKIVDNGRLGRLDAYTGDLGRVR